MKQLAAPIVTLLSMLALLPCTACGGAGGHANEPASAVPEEAGATASEPAPGGGSPASPPGAGTTAGQPEATGASAATSAGSPPASTGAASSAPAHAPERPYASTANEARSLIDEQIRAHMEGLWQCVANRIAAGTGRHRSVVLEFAIDQDGRLIGATAVGAKSHPLDPAAKACVADALREAQFPRSKSPISTVRETFTASATAGGS
jgi:hypothetical protein